MVEFPEPEAAVVARARGGDREAFAEIVRLAQDAVLTVCRRILRDAALAEECAQEAFLRAWRALPAFDAGRRFAPWLATISINCARTARARSAREPGGVPREQASAPSPDASLGDALRGAVDALPLPYREAVALHYLAGFDCAEVSRITGRPVSTVKSDLLRARALLRNRLAALFDRGGARDRGGA